jgi:hypothetical protein
MAGVQPLAQAPVGADAAGDHQLLESPVRRHAASALAASTSVDRFLEFGGEVRLVRAVSSTLARPASAPPSSGRKS